MRIKTALKTIGQIGLVGFVLCMAVFVSVPQMCRTFQEVFYWPVLTILFDHSSGSAAQKEGTTTNKGVTVQVDRNLVPHDSGTVIDLDGNIYKTVKIGDQWWMAENLRVTRYRNGDAISKVTSGDGSFLGLTYDTWEYLTNGAYCEYYDDADIVAAYGRLYNGYAVNDSRNIAPVGWHVPSDAEWKLLEMNLGMSQAEADQTGGRGKGVGGKLKAEDTTYWDSPNLGATNESGFSALAGGNRSDRFDNMGRCAVFWTSTGYVAEIRGLRLGCNAAWFRHLGYENSEVYRYYTSKQSGYSVRCVKD